MSEAKFTKGQWRISEGEGFSAGLPAGYVIDYAENWLGDTVAMVATKDKFPFDNLTANAHLIAAAPELYEALECVLGLITPEYEESPMIAFAKAVLSKARGEAL